MVLDIDKYLIIKDYIIIHDLVDGINLVKQVFRKSKPLDSYNPPLNLIWNEKNNTWENHTLFSDNLMNKYYLANYNFNCNDINRIKKIVQKKFKF